MSKESEKFARRAWYQANIEKARGYSRKWRIKHGITKDPDKRISWSRWTTERIAHLRRLRAKGASYKECAEKLGCTRPACARACDRYGIVKPKAAFVPKVQLEAALPRSSRMRMRETANQSAMWSKLLAEARP